MATISSIFFRYDRISRLTTPRSWGSKPKHLLEAALSINRVKLRWCT